MDFIERLLGVAPDAGDGSLEVFWLAAFAVVVLALVFRRRIVASLSKRAPTRHD